MLKIDYYKNTPCPISKKFLEKVVKIFCKEVTVKRSSLEVIVIGDKEMKNLNRSYRGKNITTDVLSFSFSEEKKVKTDFLGQIFISYPKIKKQAKEYKVKEKEEFTRMFIHGILHLLNYDHNTKSNEKKMFCLQEKIVEKVFL